MQDVGFWQEKLGVILEKEDEMECLVAGCNFLFRAIYHEAFMFEHAKTSFITGTGRALSMLLPSQGMVSVMLIPFALLADSVHEHLPPLKIARGC